MHNEILARFILSLITSAFFLTIMFGISLWTMIIGWGLEVQSWPVIIIGWLVTMFLVAANGAVQAALKPD